MKIPVKKTLVIPTTPQFPIETLAPNTVTVQYANAKLGGAPVVFSAETTLANGKTAVLNAQTLQSGFRTSYFIDEIRISMYTEKFTSATPLPSNLLTGLSGLVSILFQTGKYMFSKEAIPVGIMAPVFGADFGNIPCGNTDQYRSFSSVRWMLPKPLFMPAGDVILANVSLATNSILAALFSTTPCVTVTVTYVGRIIPQGFVAQSREVPWLAYWSRNASTLFDSATTRFRNPFTVPAHVQRFTQRTYKFVSSAPAEYAEVSAEAQIYDSTTPYQEISITDSRGYFITNKFFPIGDVFDASRHAWTFGRQLSPREQFNMQAKTENLSGMPANTDYITNIGLVGYRSEAP